MGLKLDYKKAERQLYRAIEIAEGIRPLSLDWETTTEKIAAGNSQTLVAGLGGALLAKATNGGIDPLSIKPEDGRPRSFAIRPLVERVLVPASRGGQHSAFHLGVRGPQPMNNQPYFRYSHLDDVERHRAGESLDVLREALRHLDSLDEEQAVEALATFVRCRMKAEAEHHEAVKQRVNHITDLRELVEVLTPFLATDQPSADLPLRLQAAFGGLVRATGASVSTQSINDPSRHAPGDVHIPDHQTPRWVAEVKARPLDQEEAQAFVRRVYEYGKTPVAWIIAIHPEHSPLERSSLHEFAQRYGIMTLVAESIVEMVTLLFAHPSSQIPAVVQVSQAISQQLVEMRAQTGTIQEWAELSSRSS